MYIIISLGLIVLTVLFVLWKKTNKLKELHPDLFSFIVTMVATFIGVLWAIDFNNKSEEKKEEKNVVKLLDASNLELEASLFKALITYEMLQNDSLYSKKKNIENNPIHLPMIFTQIINNEVVLRHITQYGIQAFSQSFDNLHSLQYAINTGVAIEDSILMRSIGAYIRQLEFSQQIVLLEKDRLEKKVNERDVEEKYTILMAQLIGFEPFVNENNIRK